MAGDTATSSIGSTRTTSNTCDHGHGPWPMIETTTSYHVVVVASIHHSLLRILHRIDSNIYFSSSPYSSLNSIPVLLAMWKKISSVVLLILAAAIRDAAAFSGGTNKMTSHPVVRYKVNSSSALCESFDDDDEYEPQEKKKGFFANFFEELDALVDDATSRRLGNGAQYYGKRKSSFYGKDDVNRKRDKVRLTV